MSIWNYFKEPFAKYDNKWKGMYYYIELRERKEMFKFLLVCIMLLTFFVTIIVKYMLVIIKFIN